MGFRVVAVEEGEVDSAPSLRGQPAGVVVEGAADLFRRQPLHLPELFQHLAATGRGWGAQGASLRATST